MLICCSAAKVNLTLDVLARRDDGYHELRSIAHTVGVWDTLVFEFDMGHGFSLRCNDQRLMEENNLCLKAARAWLEAVREARPTPLSSLRITLHKTIPQGAGLGGGSGNAAATLLALNRHFAQPLDKATLLRVATGLGADVPFFLHGGCALFEGIGERLTPLSALEGWLLVMQPQQALSTGMVFKKWDELNQPSANGTERMQGAIRSGNLAQIGAALSNDLRPAAEACGVAVGALIQVLQDCGASGAEMTGSGSAVFGLFADEAAARSAAVGARRILEQHQPAAARGVQMLVAPFCSCGVMFPDFN